MNLFAKQKNRHRCREQIYGHQEGKGKRGGLEGWGWHVFSIIFKIEMRTDYVAQGPLSVLCVCVLVSVMSDSLQPPGPSPARLLCPWDSPGKNTGVGCHSLLQGICLTQGSNPDVLHCRQILYHLSHEGSPLNALW